MPRPPEINDPNLAELQQQIQAAINHLPNRLETARDVSALSASENAITVPVGPITIEASGRARALSMQRAKESFITAGLTPEIATANMSHEADHIYNGFPQKTVLTGLVVLSDTGHPIAWSCDVGVPVPNELQAPEHFSQVAQTLIKSYLAPGEPSAQDTILAINAFVALGGDINQFQFPPDTTTANYVAASSDLYWRNNPLINE